MLEKGDYICMVWRKQGREKFLSCSVPALQQKLNGQGRQKEEFHQGINYGISSCNMMELSLVDLKGRFIEDKAKAIVGYKPR